MGLPGAADAQSRGDPHVGQSYALKVCAECHAVLPEGGPSPNPDAPAFITIANSPGMSRIALVSWFQTPHKSMPNLMLETSDRDNLIAYITGLKEIGN